MSEVGDQEKIDIVVWDDTPITYITNALSPTKVSRVVLNEANKKAEVFVPEDQLSVAIGKNGQNVRLASKLTGYDIDITSDEQSPEKVVEEVAVEATAEAKPVTQKLKKKEQLESSLLDAINEHGEEVESED
jgi:transcription antitermination factor NusA-like protein